MGEYDAHSRQDERAGERIYTRPSNFLAPEYTSQLLSNGRIKARLPDDFDGASGKVDTFLRQVQTYLAMDLGLTETAKVTLALQFCVGERAGLWANRQIKMLLKGDRDAITTLEKFGEEVEKAFGDPEQMQRAQRKLSRKR